MTSTKQLKRMISCFAAVITMAAAAISPASAQLANSNIHVASKYQPSACVTVNGIRADGQAGTPSNSPYNNGNWYPSVSSASAVFANLTGGYPLKSAGNNACVTDCGSGKQWVQNGIGGSCVNSTPPAGALCPDGSLMPSNGVCPVTPTPPVQACANGSSNPPSCYVTYVCATNVHQDTKDTKYLYEGFVSDPSNGNTPGNNQFDAAVASGAIKLVTEFFNYTASPSWKVSPYSPDADGYTSYWCQREGN